jgi:galactokinase
VSRIGTASERASLAGQQAFGSNWKPRRLAEAPGRLELLGNHVDYSGGKVIAAAIDRTIVIAVDKTRHDRTLEVVFADTPEQKPQPLTVRDLINWRNEGSPPEPIDYVRGTVAALMARDSIEWDAGVQIAISGDVPIGLGLSSSAALCVALALALSAKNLEKRELVLVAQEAEHRAGTPCGTMDQSASVAGGFILFNSSNVTFEQLKPSLDKLSFAIADSGVSRSLGASSYPTRVKESQEGLVIVKRELARDLSILADLGVSDLSMLSAVDERRLPPVILRRIRHIVTENQRVREGFVALEEGDWETFGRLMTASGQSSALDYEISHPRVEDLVAQSLEIDGVLGARMMGGGEGGTALVLVRKSSIPELDRRLALGYYDRYGMPPGVNVFENTEGARLRIAS